MTINYFTKYVYGNYNKYPIDHVTALEALTGRKTLLDRDIKALESMGFEFVEVLEPK